VGVPIEDDNRTNLYQNIGEYHMQKWDYMVVRTYGGVITLVNGQEVAQVTGAQPHGEMLYEFLGGAGEDGWEVVGMAGVREGAEIILKRPLVESKEGVEDEEGE
jgi:hypothetical protein